MIVYGLTANERTLVRTLSFAVVCILLLQGAIVGAADVAVVYL